MIQTIELVNLRTRMIGKLFNFSKNAFNIRVISRIFTRKLIDQKSGFISFITL